MTDPVGRFLVESGRLEASDLERALRLRAESGQRLGALLVSLGLIGERDLAEALAEKLGLDVAPSDGYSDSPVAGGSVSPDFLRQEQAVPVALEDGCVAVAFCDAPGEYALDAFRLAFGRPVVARVGAISDIEAAIERQYGGGSVGRIGEEIAGREERDLKDIQHLRDIASEAPVIRVVNLLISRAFEARASDIHVEPFEARLKVRYRVDGVLRDAEAPPARSAAAVISRLKVMANLDIAERRLPQDGRILMRVDGREVDIRVSTVPTTHGESVVLRVLDKESVALDLGTLGFAGSTLETLERLLTLSQGILLVTGPTGSGKTTTLYAALRSLNTPEQKILTVEDPVEYQIEGINQIHVRPRIGLSFAAALRSILRQDPDVIMVGEMRDLETAKIAVQAALTGHKVFSTLHTNDAASSVTRLLDMGVEGYLVNSTVNGVAAQRLVRVLCEHCKRPHDAAEEMIEVLGLERLGDSSPITLYQPAGCERCDGAGYKGRTGVAEILVMTDGLRRAVLDRRDASGIWRAAIEEGAVSMRDDGLAKAARGITSVEEVERVIRAV